MLSRVSSGFDMAALSGLMGERAFGASTNPLSHHRAKVKNVIFRYMSGGVSQIDSFDPKPKLRELHGQPMPVKVERTQFNNNGNIFGSPFDFRPGGKSGIPISDLFPKLREWCADELAVVRSMTSTVNEHAQGNYFFHSGFPFMGHPSAGAWVSYGLGSENHDLPGFVVLQSGEATVPHGGVGVFANGFFACPASGVRGQSGCARAGRQHHAVDRLSLQRSKLDFIRGADLEFASRTGGDAEVEAAVRNYETAFRMQAAVPELVDLSGETAATKSLYALDSKMPMTAAYGRQALLARRLVERGVRFVELSCLPQSPGGGQAANPWDQHGGLEKGHGNMARQVDQPIAALLVDLKARGLLDETLVIWAGEFGRTPFSQGSDGRDHNPYGFSVWLAGGGVKGGTIYGAADELGYHVTEGKSTIYDLWATVLHLLGMNQENLTYLHAGRNVRLTDVRGRVMTEILS